MASISMNEKLLIQIVQGEWDAFNNGFFFYQNKNSFKTIMTPGNLELE